MRRVPSLTPVVMFALVLIGLGFSLTNDARKMPSMLMDKATPTFALASLDDDCKGLSSTDLKGQGTGVTAQCIWLWVFRLPRRTSDADAARRERHGADLWHQCRILARSGPQPYVRVGFDESGRVGIDLGVTGVPESFVVDRTGRIRYRHAGPLMEDVWHEVFEPLLAQLQVEP